MTKTMTTAKMMVAAAMMVTSAAIAAEWKIGDQIYPNKAEAQKAARLMSYQKAQELFENPSGGYLSLEKGKTQYIAIYANSDNAEKEKFRCEKRNGEALTFKGEKICVLTVKQYANKVLYPAISLEKQQKDESGFKMANK